MISVIGLFLLARKESPFTEIVSKKRKKEKFI